MLIVHCRRRSITCGVCRPSEKQEQAWGYSQSSCGALLAQISPVPALSDLGKTFLLRIMTGTQTLESYGI